MTVTVNCDMGEAFGLWTLGDDEALMPLISMANVACGFHAGDPVVMRATVAAAKAEGVHVGAHPSYPDLQGFGRRAMDMGAEELTACILYQAGALKAFLDASFATKAAMMTDDAVWEKIKDVMNTGGDDALFKQLRDDYRAGIVQHYAAGDMKPASEAFAVMAKFGGPDVVGEATELADGTFWKGYHK